MKILITGGAGFVGSHLCKKYVTEGHTVLAVDNFISGSLNNIRDLLNHKNFKLIVGDIKNFDLLEKLIPGVDAVIHLAAQIHVDRSIIEPKLTYDTNIFGTLNVLELARMHDIKKIIHASTSEVYGSALYAPMDEEHPLNAPHPYGASKIAADRLCYAYYKTYGINVNIARPFNLYGPYQKDSGYGGVISIFANRVMNNSPPIIYGDGRQTRDYTYVKDIVDAYDKLLHYDKDLKGESINFGTGVEVSIAELANKIIALLGKSNHIKPVFVDPRPGEVLRLCANNKRAKEILGWTPKYSLDDGLKEFIEWYQNYKSAEWSKPNNHG